jgi:hypothetical protein
VFFRTSRPAMKRKLPPTQCARSLGVKRPQREADHSHPSSKQVKNNWSYASAAPIRLHGMHMVKEDRSTPAHTRVLLYDYPFVHKIFQHIQKLYRTSTWGENNLSFRIREVRISCQNGNRLSNLGTL